MTQTRQSHEVLWDLIKDTRFCMLSHRHADGSLHSHPLTTQNKALDEGASLYFFVSKSTEVGQRLRQDGDVNLSYANPKDDTYVKENKLLQMLKLGKAAAGGSRPELGEHAQLHFG